MKVKIEQFCSLATSPSWQAWLYHFNIDLYRKFIKRLQESKGCKDNRSLMVEILQEIDKLDDNGKLADFLSKQYPHMLEGLHDNVVKSDDNVFEYYNPSILTYPRRIIFTGDRRSLLKTVNEFVLDKIKYDSIIVGQNAYVEYLNKTDIAVVEKVPSSNWQIAAYRLRNA